MMHEVGIPVAAFIIFFVIEAFGAIGEWALTLLLCLTIALMFKVRYHPREGVLFAIGTLIGVIIEIGLRKFGYQQIWADPTLAGVPIWLPLSWGFGFVVFTRIGYNVRHLR